MFRYPTIGKALFVLSPLWIACSSSSVTNESPAQTLPPPPVIPGGMVGMVNGVGGAGAGATAGVAGTGTTGIAGTPGVAGAPAFPPAGAAGMVGGFGGRGGRGTAGFGAPTGRAGAPAPGGPAGMGGVAGMVAGAAGMVAAAGAPAPGTDMFAAERQACVDHINMYRATLMLPPLKRGTPEQETCSDEGAKSDGDTGQAHGSAGKCRGLGGQNTCPGWPLRNGALTPSLTQCLDQMWAEGEPPNGVQACIQDRTGCFQMYGHWINMSMTNYTTVACGFYKMANGRYWMNQNFGR